MRNGFKPSTNEYDWLGHGIYFWEDNEERAWKWAEELCEKHNKEKPAVLCAKIDLGNCLDLMKDDAVRALKSTYHAMDMLYKSYGYELPQNRNIKGDNDWKLRMLDCSVINFLHTLNEDEERKPYDTVRSAFTEGNRIYRGSSFKDNTHIQLAVRNPECILEIIDVTC